MGRAFNYNGSAWSAPDFVGGGGLHAVACPSTSHCVAVDGVGRALTYDGSSWGTPAVIDNAGPLIDVACPSTSFCMALDEAGNVLTYSSGSWSGPTNLGVKEAIPAISCASASFCMAIENSYSGSYPTGVWSGRARIYNGSSWSSPTTIHSLSGWGGRLADVSCSSSSFCVAVGSCDAAEYHEIATYNGSSWSVRPPENGLGLQGVSCLSPSFCAAVGFEIARAFDGSSWSYVDAGADELAEVSCLSGSFCLAVGRSEGTVYNGSSWSSPASINSDNLEGVSCPSPTLCLVVDGSGNAFTYTGGAPADKSLGTGSTGQTSVPPLQQPGEPPRSTVHKKKPLKCHKGFAKKKVKGKAKCVKVKGHHPKHHKT